MNAGSDPLINNVTYFISVNYKTMSMIMLIFALRQPNFESTLLRRSCYGCRDFVSKLTIPTSKLKTSAFLLCQLLGILTGFFILMI